MNGRWLLWRRLWWRAGWGGPVKGRVRRWCENRRAGVYETIDWVLQRYCRLGLWLGKLEWAVFRIGSLGILGLLHSSLFRF